MQTTTIDLKLLKWFTGLPPTAKQDFIIDMRRFVDGSRYEAWPAQYTNADTGKTYQSHLSNKALEAFIYNDEPRYMLLKGGEGCVAAETLINGIPIAEWTGGNVTTLFGSQVSTAAFQKGRAALYRLRTKSGREVVVTSGHRFLSPFGWYQLKDLSVGNLLAVHDTDHALQHRETTKDYQGYCFGGFRPYGELPTPTQVDALDKWQQLAKILSSLLCFWRYDALYPFHLYSAYDFSLSARSLLENALGYHLYQNDAEGIHQSSLRVGQQQRATTHFDKALLPLSCHVASLFFKLLSLLCSSDSLPRMELFQSRELYPMDKAHRRCHTDQGLSFEEAILQYLYQSEFSDLFSFLSYDYPFNNGVWDIIDDISFVGNKEYYDLTVPVCHHYVANGIIHHNSGKSTAGVIKTLNRLHRGMNGIMIGPDLEHFKKSLWPEFRRWCPWESVIERHRYRQRDGWEPSKAFTLVFKNKEGGFSELICGGAKETEIGSWEGPNISFVHFDEARRHKTPAALKVFDGRARIPGPNGERSQIYFTTTPRKHWLYEYFAGATGDETSRATVPQQIMDQYQAFKSDAFVATILTRENANNLEPGFVDMRAQTLNEAERRILLEAEWEDESDIEKFVNITWWDSCQGPLPPFNPHDPMVIALDANKGSEVPGAIADCFSMIGLSRNGERVVVRYCGIWQPQPGQLMDFEPIEAELVRLCKTFAVIEVCYDPYQLHDMASRLKKQGLANFQEFGQASPRLKADKQLQDLIMGRRIIHDGNPLLRQHIDNANIKKAGNDGVRIVKRSPSLKVDAAVALSMAAARAMYYSIG